MRRCLLLLVGLTGVLIAVEEQETAVLEEEIPLSVLEGTVVRDAEGVLPLFLRTDGGQRCLLREHPRMLGDVKLRDLVSGTRVRLEGEFDSFFRDAQKRGGEPETHISTWIIFMDVRSVKQLDQAIPPGIPVKPLPKAPSEH